MCSLPHLLHDIAGSTNRVGAVIDDARECGSGVAGSVDERGNVAGDNVGGVPLFSARFCLTPVGSVVRREVGGGIDVAEVDTALLDKGEATTAVELTGLSVGGILNTALLGELGLEEEWVRRLFLNCCLSSKVPRC